MTEASERRMHRRLPIHMRVTVLRQGRPSDQEGVTRNVSANGVYMTVPASTELDGDIQFVITIPSEVTMEFSLEVECAGKVLRIDPVTSKTKDVAVSIQSHRFKNREASGGPTEPNRLPELGSLGGHGQERG